eukprot:CAMPEP_0113679602 /NCGR_PEP_ID=MMETSP0038_2-20120614/10753_1 /TAXON_ID=2898 /ORGANISM="Cryptomonas paramecium" /LENGTH=168 /DNA_ID=CAMNT_0000597687 /DNA_START=33 /DNA_END=539 /DNA_ORIENTATION=+ /assembly_acc=CAM_ASM_000170
MPSTDVKNTPDVVGKTYLELIQTNLKDTAMPSPPKSKRERADENWKILESIISDAERFEKGSQDRSKCLERLHEKIRHLAKRPRLGCLNGGVTTRPVYASAQDEFVDFLAPTCSLCGQAEDGSCKCEELAANAESFLADSTGMLKDSGDKDEIEEEKGTSQPEDLVDL